MMCIGVPEGKMMCIGVQDSPDGVQSCALVCKKQEMCPLRAPHQILKGGRIRRVSRSRGRCQALAPGEQTCAGNPQHARGRFSQDEKTGHFLEDAQAVEIWPSVRIFEGAIQVPRSQRFMARIEGAHI
jgi:hypothetical protein